MIAHGITVEAFLNKLDAHCGGRRLLLEDVLVRNEVGNLAIMRAGAYIGYLDVMTGEVESAVQES